MKHRGIGESIRAVIIVVLGGAYLFWKLPRTGHQQDPRPKPPALHPVQK